MVRLLKQLFNLSVSDDAKHGHIPKRANKMDVSHWGYSMPLGISWRYVYYIHTITHTHFELRSWNALLQLLQPMAPAQSDVKASSFKYAI